MSAIKVTRIRLKAGKAAHTHVSHIGGPAGGGWLMLAAQAIRTIERGTNDFYMIDETGERLEIAIEQGPQRKHLRARRAGAWCDALLGLEGCEG